MKATIDIPDELYREVKAKTAREGKTVRETAIELFSGWVEKRTTPTEEEIKASAEFWKNYRPAKSPRTNIKDHSMEAIRKSIAKGRMKEWEEKYGPRP